MLFLDNKKESLIEVNDKDITNITLAFPMKKYLDMNYKKGLIESKNALIKGVNAGVDRLIKDKVNLDTPILFEIHTDLRGEAEDYNISSSVFRNHMLDVLEVLVTELKDKYDTSGMTPEKALEASEFFRPTLPAELVDFSCLESKRGVQILRSNSRIPTINISFVTEDGYAFNLFDDDLYNGNVDITIYTDGACSQGSNCKTTWKGGWGVYWKETDTGMAGGTAVTTNNRMELEAFIEGLKLIENTIKFKSMGNLFIGNIKICTDSAYVYNTINAKWYVKWMENDWINSKKEAVKNKDLWEKLLDIYIKLEETAGNSLKVVKVKAHSGDKYNGMADKLAVHGKTKLSDTGKLEIYAEVMERGIKSGE